MLPLYFQDPIRQLSVLVVTDLLSQEVQYLAGHANAR